ncbi:hypothetical protein ROJ8625_02906 [Roseivivax jejudonensis]|uniref:Uncharacterized protein n=1 Tax=Roseivivax jejudonensis TaxID=1529041 RepID=A0A1X6ZPQ8_9RHOB|nr:hypothetical protein ROJ8625_02906 [Roseivivax jejudonensis]
MDFIADIVLALGALGAGFYCFVLARRLARFTDLEGGVGGAVAVLSAQVDDLSKTLDAARSAAGTSQASLMQLTERAEEVAQRLELLVAAMHDLPDPAATDGRTSRDRPGEGSAEPVPAFTSRSAARPAAHATPDGSSAYRSAPHDGAHRKAASIDANAAGRARSPETDPAEPVFARRARADI